MKTFRIGMVVAVILMVLSLPDASPVKAFGKNKVTYSTFDWKLHTTEHFEFYYYPEAAELIPDVILYFETAYARISADLGTDLTGRIPVILYRTYSDFQQTNVLSGFIPRGVGGFSEPLKRRIVIPLQNSKKDLESLINHELVHSFQFEIFYQNRINRIAPVPLWLMEGSAEHLAADWDAVGRMVLRDAVINGYLPGLDRLETFDYLPSPYMGYKIAQSAVDYIRERYGIDRLRALLWEVRKTLRSPDYFKTAIESVFDVSLEELTAGWQDNLRRRIIEIERRRESIVQFEKIVSPTARYYRRLSPVYGVGNEVIHFLEAGQDGLHIYTGAEKDPEKNELLNCLTCGMSPRKYRQIVTEGRALTGCLNDGRLVFLNQFEDKFYVQILDPAVGGLVQSVELSENAPASPAFSPDGRQVAYSGWIGTQSDIFILDLETGKSRKLTDDEYVDRTPYWSPDGTHIVYSSERKGQFDIYAVRIDTGATHVLVSDPGDAITPAWSPDGKKIVFISDRLDGILDPYVLDLETMKSHRIAAPVTGCMTPSFSIDSSKIALTFYYRGSERIVVIPADRAPVIPEIASDVEPLGTEGESTYSKMVHAQPDTETPSSADELTDDPVPFRLVPDYAVGMISYGTSGEFVAEGGVILSDILGDHRFEFIGRRRDSQNGIFARYLYLRHRIDHGVLLSQDSDYYYLYDTRFGIYREVNWDEYLGVYFMHYPFSTYYRAELNFGYEHLDYDSVLPGFDNYDQKMAYIEPAVSGDTIQYKLMMGYPEVYRGWRFRISSRIPIPVSDTFEDYYNTYIDFREYVPLRKRSVLAFRQWGVFSHGDDTRYFGVGGPGTLRGYSFKQLVGNRVVIGNLEIRFPILDEVVFPGNIGFYGFRAKLFVDCGAVWSDDESFEWKLDDPDTDVREGSWAASFGWGINFWMIGVEWHLEWARRTDFKTADGDWTYEWSIRRSF